MEASEILRDVIALLIVPLLLWGFTTLSKLNTTIAELRATVQALQESLHKQDSSLAELYGQTRDIDKRLTRVEARVK